MAKPRDPARDGRSAGAAFVIVTVAIDAMGIGLILPVMPELLRGIGGFDLATAARWGGWLAFSYAVMQFLFGPLVGDLSDRFGRRPVLLVSLAALVVDYLVMAAAPVLWLLFAARIMSGVAGATYSTANAYIADISAPEKRAANFGLVGAGFGIGFIFGPGIGGLLGEFGPRAPFVAAAALAGGNLVFGLLFAPESLPPDRRRPLDLRRSDPFSALRDAGRLPGLGWFVAAIFVYSLSHNVFPAVWSYFSMEVFAWGPGEVGVSLVLVGVGMAFTQGWLIRRAVARFGELRTVVFGLCVNVVAMTAVALATEGWMAFALSPLFALGVMAGPALQGLMSRMVGEDAQGRLQGVLASVQAIASILSPLVMTQVFWAFSNDGAPVRLPGAPFLLAAALMALVVAPLALGLKARRRGGAEGARRGGRPPRH